VLSKVTDSKLNYQTEPKTVKQWKRTKYKNPAPNKDNGRISLMEEESLQREEYENSVP